MKPGRVIAVVGPSGVGKDSVMAGIVVAQPAFELVQRDITRAAHLGGEEFTPLSEEAFAAKRAAGGYCLDWRAHGLCYGIPNSVRDRANAGQDFLINLSRAVLAQAHEVFGDFRVLHLTAKPETLITRIQGRGRESADEIRLRLARSGADIPAHLTVVTLSNDGALDETVAQALALFYPERV